MTEHPTQPDDPRASYERSRDAFGRALIGAARAQEQGREAVAPRRRRRRSIAVVGGLALAGGLAALAVGITLPGGDGDATTPGRQQVAIGAAPAVAAVTAIRDALHSGVLVRDVTTDGRDPMQEGRRLRTRMRDWTDLSTRDQHVKFLEGPILSEFWNPSANERIEIQPPEYLAPDGRRVVTVAKDTSVENMSASQSPAEEMDWLLKEAEAGRIAIRDGGRRGERVLEATGRCFSWNEGGTMECAEGDANPKNGDAHWPDSPPKGAEAVRMYRRWWITDDAEAPRMLRYENGTLSPQGTARRVTLTSVWNEWKVLPRTPANLALVRPPAFDPATYLVIHGNNSVVSRSLKAGKIVCRSDRPAFFCDLR